MLESFPFPPFRRPCSFPTVFTLNLHAIYQTFDLGQEKV